MLSLSLFADEGTDSRGFCLPKVTQLPSGRLGSKSSSYLLHSTGIKEWSCGASPHPPLPSSAPTPSSPGRVRAAPGQPRAPPFPALPWLRPPGWGPVTPLLQDPRALIRLWVPSLERGTGYSITCATSTCLPRCQAWPLKTGFLGRTKEPKTSEVGLEWGGHLEGLQWTWSKRKDEGGTWTVWNTIFSFFFFWY